MKVEQDVTERTPHIGVALVYGPDTRELQYFPANPDTTDPLERSRAFIASGNFFGAVHPHCLTYIF